MNTKLIISIVVLSLLSVLCMAQNWYDNDWGSRVKITIDKTMVSGSNNLTDFPFLVNITNEDIKNGAQADGDDILFTSSDGTTKLDHEIEVWDPSTGGLVAWVRIPSLSYTANTEIYVYYANNAAANQQNVNAVWDSNYRAVWHMTGGNNTTLFESTSNPNNGTKGAVGEPANSSSGKIGGVQNFDGSNDFVNCGSDASLDNITAKTIEFWTKLDNLYPGGIQGSHFLNKGGTPYWFVATDNTTGGRNIYASGFSTTNGRWSFPKFNTGEWYYVAIMHNNGSASNDPVIYVNGVSQAITEYSSPVGTASSDAAQDLQMSKDPSNSRWIDGLMDEVRISNITRSTDWIITQYRNQNSSVYITVDEDEVLPVELSSFTAVLSAENYVTLKWITQSETGVSGYYVYRSLDNNWTNAIKISNMIPSVNSTTQQVYLYTDEELEDDGTYYYWLQVNDFDGSSVNHGPTSIYFSSIGGTPETPPVAPIAGINSIYPNPITPYSVITYTLTKAADVKFKVYNSRGQLINSFSEGYKTNGEFRTGWDGKDSSGKDCPVGVYYIKLQAGKDSTIRKAVIIK